MMRTCLKNMISKKFNRLTVFELLHWFTEEILYLPYPYMEKGDYSWVFYEWGYFIWNTFSCWIACTCNWNRALKASKCSRYSHVLVWSTTSPASPTHSYSCPMTLCRPCLALSGPLSSSMLRTATPTLLSQTLTKVSHSRTDLSLPHLLRSISLITRRETV